MCVSFACASLIINVTCMLSINASDNVTTCCPMNHSTVLAPMITTVHSDFVLHIHLDVCCVLMHEFRHTVFALHPTPLSCTHTTCSFITPLQPQRSEAEPMAGLMAVSRTSWCFHSIAQKQISYTILSPSATLPHTYAQTSPDML